MPHLSSPVFKVLQHLPCTNWEGCLDAVVRGSGHSHDAAHAATGRTSSHLVAEQAAEMSMGTIHDAGHAACFTLGCKAQGCTGMSQMQHLLLSAASSVQAAAIQVPSLGLSAAKSP